MMYVEARESKSAKLLTLLYLKLIFIQKLGTLDLVRADL